MSTAEIITPDQRSSRKLWRHLDEEEKERAKFALKSFGCTLLVMLIWISLSEFYQEKKYEYQMRSFHIRLTDFAQLEKAGRGSNRFDFHVTDFYNILYDKFPDSQEEQAGLVKLADELDNIALSTPRDRPRIVENFEQAKTAIILERFPLVNFQRQIWFWLGSGFLYLVTIFMLYSFYLHPAKGEPVFNVIDVAFFAILVEYSGGLYSPFILVFLLSILLSAADYLNQEMRPEYRMLSPWKKFVPLLGPYIAAIFIHLFWATNKEAFLNKVTWLEYILVCLAYIAIGTGTWFIFRIVLQLKMKPTT